MSLPRASWSLNSLSRASSSWVIMPSAMLWFTPSFQPVSQGLVDGVAVRVGALGYGGHGEQELILVEVGGPGGLGGELYHFLPAGLVCLAALGVFTG